MAKFGKVDLSLPPEIILKCDGKGHHELFCSDCGQRLIELNYLTRKALLEELDKI